MLRRPFSMQRNGEAQKEGLDNPFGFDVQYICLLVQQVNLLPMKFND